MHIKNFRIQNYKSHIDSGPITLKPGFNIFTGQNNAGKTALLEGLTLQFQNKPHRSLATIPTAEHSVTSRSQAYLQLAVSQNELMEFLKQHQGKVVIPMPAVDLAPSEGQLLAFGPVTRQPELQVDLIIGAESSLRLASRRTSFGLYEASKQDFWLSLQWNKDNQPTAFATQSPRNSPTELRELGLALGEHLQSRIYSFRAERMNIGSCSFGHNRILATDAHNLPEVLNVLQGNSTRFDRYNRLVKRVLPQVERVTVRPIPNNQVEILVWTEDPGLEREDLAFPLSENGTGISQVLAMLYILVTSESPRTIIIDEPNSFLHPGAVRALVEIFQEQPLRHQYIVSTHSPDLTLLRQGLGM